MVVRLIVTGRVQGVWFRASTRAEALRLGLLGRVKNLANGAVEVIAEGDDRPIEQLILWANKGPLMAEVRDVRVEYLSDTPSYQTFEVIH
ncbi:MAG: acylphosphatase [Chromatiales bacterium]|nr:acylphosphatase [Chromatiales bacterium]